MTDAEVEDFLRTERMLACATIWQQGFPHVVPLWYVVRGAPVTGGPRLWAWTYRSSQKVKNLERCARASVLVEAGDRSSNIRGVMIAADVRLHDRYEDVLKLGLELLRRHDGEISDSSRGRIERQAHKRVGLEFVERRRVSWDHRKLSPEERI